MAGNALQFGHWFVLNLVLFHFSSNFRMAVKANLPWLAFDQIRLIGTMGAMAGETVALGKGGMGGLFGFLADQSLMTG
jgi:hypothetical protein